MFLYLFKLCVLFRLIEELPDCHKDRENKSSSQNNEDSSNVLHTQGTGLFTLFLRAAIPSPPFLLHHVQLPFFLELQDCYGDLISVWRAWGGQKERKNKSTSFDWKRIMTNRAEDSFCPIILNTNLSNWEKVG